MSHRLFAYAKTKTQISFAVTAKLISAFVFATRIEQSLYFLYVKFQASNHLMRLYSPVSVGPCRKPRRPVFSQRGSNYSSLTVETYTDVMHKLHVSLFGRLLYDRTKHNYGNYCSKGAILLPLNVRETKHVSSHSVGSSIRRASFFQDY